MSILSGELRTISGLDCLASSLFSIGKTYSIVPQKKKCSICVCHFHVVQDARLFAHLLLL